MKLKKQWSILVIGAFLLAPIASSAQTDTFKSQYENFKKQAKGEYKNSRAQCLVRDLLGLKCILIYYPSHLASAVCFNQQVKGDYILLNGNKYVVCDPTYIGAPVGLTMPNMDNESAKVIILE